MRLKGKKIRSPFEHATARRAFPVVLLVFHAISLVGTVSPAAAASSSEDDLLIPAIAFEGMSLTAGAWCRYLVVESSETRRDSSELYIAIPGDSDPPSPGSFWLEIEGKERHGDTLAMRVLMSDAVRSGDPADSTGARVLEIFIKHGSGPIESGDEELVGRLESELSKGRRDLWEDGGKASVRAAGRDFRCVKKMKHVAYEKKVPAGRSTLLKRVDDVHEIYFAGAVPLFHIVRYVSRRSRESKIDPPIPGVPVAGVRKSETELLLIDFGSGARSLFAGRGGKR
jgi:hypothetical protein